MPTTKPMGTNPCPFCHSDNVGRPHGSGYPLDHWSVPCKSCHADGPLADTEAEAVRLWNGAGEDLQKKIKQLEAQLKSTYAI